MPINEDEWNECQLPSKLKPEIISFLESNKSDAYTDMEILDYMQNFSDEPWGGFLTSMGSLRPIQEALKELIDEGTIETKTIDRENSSPAQYYKAK